MTVLEDGETTDVQSVQNGPKAGWNSPLRYPNTLTDCEHYKFMIVTDIIFPVEYLGLMHSIPVGGNRCNDVRRDGEYPVR